MRAKGNKKKQSLQKKRWKERLRNSEKIYTKADKSVDLPYTSNLRLRERIQTKQKYKGR